MHHLKIPFLIIWPICFWQSARVPSPSVYSSTALIALLRHTLMEAEFFVRPARKSFLSKPSAISSPVASKSLNKFHRRSFKLPRETSQSGKRWLSLKNSALVTLWPWWGSSGSLTFTSRELTWASRSSRWSVGKASLRQIQTSPFAMPGMLSWFVCSFSNASDYQRHSKNNIR